MQKTFWYRFGAFIGLLLRTSVYSIGIYGIATSLWNREIPYVPVILLLVFSAWTKVLAIYEGVSFLVKNVQTRRDASEIQKINNLINFTNRYGGSPN